MSSENAGYGDASLWRRAGIVAATLAALATTSGCVGTVYAVKAYSAQSKVETAQALGAEKYAPFEYYYAREHLTKAQEQAASADYGDAIDLADEAETYADKAIKLSKQAHEGAGR